MRSNWLDIAKGITIMLMVMGHSSIPHSLAVFIWHSTCLCFLLQLDGQRTGRKGHSLNTVFIEQKH